MIKTCTTFEQSKMLAEILSRDSADMVYAYSYSVNEYATYPCLLSSSKHFDVYKDDIPCWSLAALLSVIPKHVKDYNVLRIDISDNDFAIWYDEIGFGVNNELPDITKESAVDACVEMIVNLKKINLL